MLSSISVAEMHALLDHHTTEQHRAMMANGQGTGGATNQQQGTVLQTNSGGATMQRQGNFAGFLQHF